MNNINQIEESLYTLMHILKRDDKCIKMWSLLRKDKDILRNAIKVKRDKFDEKDTLNCLTISELILRDYENVDKNIYDELISAIYSSKDIARIVLDGYSNGGYSFLLLSLMNNNLVLTDEEKWFAEKEAMYKIGTSRFNKIKENFYKSITKKKNNNEYLNNTLYSLNTKQAHGNGAFDIRYHILHNNNWSNDEKRKLLYNFYDDFSEYVEYFNEWESSIVNDSANYIDSSLPILNYQDLYNYTYTDLLEIYNDKGTAKRIYNEIEFCKLMLRLRPIKEKNILLNDKNLILNKKI